jgi:hypothetical protein
VEVDQMLDKTLHDNTALPVQTGSLPAGARGRPGLTTAAGGFYLCMAGINAGLALGDAQLYQSFADRAVLPFVRAGWADIVMAHPVVWIMLLAAGEACIGTALLLGGRPARAGWVAVVVFHLLLMLFGWWIWVWCVPAILLALSAARHDWPRLGRSMPGC